MSRRARSSWASFSESRTAACRGLPLDRPPSLMCPEYRHMAVVSRAAPPPPAPHEPAPAAIPDAVRGVRGQHVTPVAHTPHRSPGPDRQWAAHTRRSARPLVARAPGCCVCGAGLNVVPCVFRDLTRNGTVRELRPREGCGRRSCQWRSAYGYWRSPGTALRELIALSVIVRS